MKIKASVYLLAILLLPNALLGGANTTSPPGVSFKRDVLPIFADRCASCHMLGDNQGGFILEEKFAYPMIVNVPSVESKLLRVQPGEPDRSYLYLKVTNNYLGAGGRGWLMPVGFFPLPQNDVETIRNWILSGAPNN